MSLTWPLISVLVLWRMAEAAASSSKVMFSMAARAFSSDRQAGTQPDTIPGNRVDSHARGWGGGGRGGEGIETHETYNT